ncbi:MAG TPA: SURF1 family protein [Gammaproteobacteria bacterium]|nr:SURF1 family protein [Gammaproteobacteria bacterium]
MHIKIKNWKLALLALVFFCFFISLGGWQLSRAQQKQALIAAFNQRTEQQPLTAAELSSHQDLRFYRVTLEGRFDHQHTLLLDNKTFKRQVGYAVYTPFIAKGLAMPILIDRGFVPSSGYRHLLPTIKTIPGNITITGMLNKPPTYVSLGGLLESKSITWPLRVQFIDLSQLTSVLPYSLFAYVVNLSPDHPAAYPISWDIVISPPERHLGYALQWFALALTLLVLFVVLNGKR